MRTVTKAVLAAYGATIFVLCVIAVPWVHYVNSRYRAGENRIVGSDYAPIWSTPVWDERYPDKWIGPDTLEEFNRLSRSDQDDILSKYVNDHLRDAKNLLEWFRSQPKHERDDLIARLRKSGHGYNIKGDFKGSYRREINVQRLLLELLGVSAIAGVGLVLTTFFKRQRQTEGMSHKRGEQEGCQAVENRRIGFHK